MLPFTNISEDYKIQCKLSLKISLINSSNIGINKLGQLQKFKYEKQGYFLYFKIIISTHSYSLQNQYKNKYIYVYKHLPFQSFFSKESGSVRAHSRSHPLMFAPFHFRTLHVHTQSLFAPYMFAPKVCSHPTCSRPILIGFVFNNFVIKFWQVYSYKYNCCHSLKLIK